LDLSTAAPSSHDRHSLRALSLLSEIMPSPQLALPLPPLWIIAEKNAGNCTCTADYCVLFIKLCVFAPKTGPKNATYY